MDNYYIYSVKTILKRSNFFLIILLFVISTINLAQSRPSSHQAAADTIAVDSLNALSGSFRYTNLDSMDIYAQEAYEMATELDYIPGLVEATRLKVVNLLVNGNYPEASRLLFAKKLKLENTAYAKEKAIIDYYLGINYNASGDYKVGLPYLLDALEVFQNLNEKTYELQSLNNLGVCYIRLEKFQDALEIFLELEAMDSDHPGIVTTIAVNLAYSHYGLGDYTKAHKVLKDFFDLPKDQINERGYGFAYFKLGEVYVQQNNISEAIDAFNSSIAIYEKFKSHNDKVEPLIGLAGVYLENNDYTNATIYANQAVKLAKASGILSHQKLSLNTSYKILKAQNKYHEALQVHEQYEVVVDSIVSTQQSAEMGHLTAQYEFNQQRNKLLLEQKEAKHQSLELQNRQQLTINISIIVILAIVILLAFIYRGYKLKMKINMTLRAKNEEIRTQRDKLKEINKIKNKLFSIIGHDLRSPISTLNGLLYLLKNKMANNEDIEIVMPSLIENFDHTSDLLNNLLSWTTSQMEGYTLDFKNFDIQAVLDGVLENSKFKLEEKSIKCHIEGEGSLVYGEQNMVEIVCQNLLGNAIKFCEPGDTIHIKISTSDEICVSIRDTGIGISEEKVKSLLNENGFSSTEGTNNEQGSGLGLTICKDFLIKHNTELQIESSENEGSTFSFCLPKAS